MQDAKSHLLSFLALFCQAAGALIVTFCNMAHSTQSAAVLEPTDEVPSWVEGDKIGVYTQGALATMVLYDASVSFVIKCLAFSNAALVCTFDTEVCASFLEGVLH